MKWFATHSAPPPKTTMGQKKYRATKKYQSLTRIQKRFWPVAGRRKRKRRRSRNLFLKQEIKKKGDYLAVDTTQIPQDLELRQQCCDFQVKH
jgi:hypothetical protein